MDSRVLFGAGHDATNKPVLQVAVPPGSGGVADYARLLADAFAPYAVVSRFSESDRLNAANGQHVFIQYSGYGYARRGAPLWLITEAKRLKKEGCTVGIFFHELYATGPPWRSSFWLSPAQRWVARRLACAADYWMTSREASYEWLRSNGNKKPAMSLPISSTVGESESFSVKREQRVIIFGGAYLRAITYREAGSELFQWAAHSGLTVHDIGPPVLDAEIEASMKRNRVVQHGVLSAERICHEMSNAIFGLISYPATHLAKSSVFAAYCSHGLCPVVLGRGSLPTDGLTAGEHYLFNFPNLVEFPEGIEIGKNARNWYVKHGIQAHSEAVDRLYNKALDESIRTGS